MTSAIVPQILTVVFGIGAVVAVILTLPDGPRISRPRRKRTCGHRQGPWVCVADRDHPESGHYYRKAAH